MSTVSIIAASETTYTRHPRPDQTTHAVLGAAVRSALSQAGYSNKDVDGFGVSSFTLGSDHAIDLAWSLGFRLSWIMQDTNGGASAGNMLQHGVRAIESGDANVIVLVAGDRMDSSAFETLVRHYNKATENHLAPLPLTGPNALFAMLTERQMVAEDINREDYGHIAIAQREWAGLNPGAVYRAPLSMADYLDAPMVAGSLGRYDCVPSVTGANAIVLVADEAARGRRRARVLSVTGSYNHDNQRGDGLQTGLAFSQKDAWERASMEPSAVDVASIYDDYPSMVVAQLRDIGVIERGDTSRFIREQIATRRFPVNTSGGQLSAGQAGSAGGMHGLVEVVRQLRGEATGRQVDAQVGIVSGYGMVLYRYGACANLTILERAE